MSKKTPAEDRPKYFQTSVVADVFRALDERFAQGKTNLLPDDYLQLRGVFGDLFERALDIIDRKLIVCYHIASNPPSASNREQLLLEVAGSKPGIVYKLLPNVNFCPCIAFRFRTLHGDSAAPLFTCKHVLACRLAQLLRTNWRPEATSAEQFAILLDQYAQQLV